MRGRFAAGVAAVLIAGSAWAQVVPQTFRLDQVTCRDLLALPPERQDRLLIYLNGYMDGTQRASTWDERIVGERINRALAECRTNPDMPAMRAFSRAWSP
jgi:hypothetical protein